ncbi:MAG: hypothetical protein B6U76_11000 [Desulfurococcales archaeon ex4484_217_2]|nr:MAG: hypothetical protein B6U76_11000 [Desulfurococcales archaeon ex4484_217_2]
MARYLKRRRVVSKDTLALVSSSLIALLVLFANLIVFKVADYTKTLVIAGPLPVLLPYDVNFINTLVLFVIILITPYALVKYMNYRRKRKVELLIPVFLYDLAGLVRAGYTVPKALEIESEKDLGPLTDLIKKAVTRIILGEDVSRALSETFKDQTLITRRFIETVAEAHESGGRAAQVLSGASSHAARLEAFEEERRRSMKVYVSIIYASIIIFMVASAFLLFFNTALYESVRRGGGRLFAILLTPEQMKGLLYYTTLLIAAPSCIAIGKIRSGTIVEGVLHMAFLYIIIALFYTNVDYLVSMLMSFLPL